MLINNTFKTINPVNAQELSNYNYLTSEQLSICSDAAFQSYQKWKKLSLNQRLIYFEQLIRIIKIKKVELAHLITLEMGKPINESLAEIEKCIWCIECYLENAPKWLTPMNLNGDGKDHKLLFEPLGVVLSIMPWNFPFWQALRFAIPTIMAGNTTLLKPAEATTACGIATSRLFVEAGFPENVIQTILVNNDQIESLISSSKIQGVSFTGSTQVGKKIAKMAGTYLKKCVLELGGSDPFIVFEDANLSKAVDAAFLSRFLNCGQSCIAAKRIYLSQKIFNDFVIAFKNKIKNLNVGDPVLEGTTLGPLVSKKAQLEIQNQVEQLLSHGAKNLIGGQVIQGDGFYYQPTLLVDPEPNYIATCGEIFGPVAVCSSFDTIEEVSEKANMSPFGLCASVWTFNKDKINYLTQNLEVGSIFVNSLSKSDPRIPFGGIKESGLGRELGEFGIKEFVNFKSVNIF